MLYLANAALQRKRGMSLTSLTALDVLLWLQKCASCLLMCLSLSAYVSALIQLGVTLVVLYHWLLTQHDHQRTAPGTHATAVTLLVCVLGTQGGLLLSAASTTPLSLTSDTRLLVVFAGSCTLLCCGGVFRVLYRCSLRIVAVLRGPTLVTRTPATAPRVFTAMWLARDQRDHRRRSAKPQFVTVMESRHRGFK